MTMKRAIEMLERLANHPKNKISSELISKYEQDFKDGKSETFQNLMKLLRDNIESDSVYIRDILEELQPKRYSPQKKKK